MNATDTPGPSRRTVLAGRIVTGLTVSLLLLDAFGKVATLAPVIEGTARLGYLSSILGAILLTGYFGGAVASHVRIQDPLWTHVFSPIYMGALVWVGIVLRDNRLRALIPWRSKPIVV